MSILHWRHTDVALAEVNAQNDLGNLNQPDRLQSKLLKVKTLALSKPNPKNVLPTSIISYQAHSRAVVVFTG